MLLLSILTLFVGPLLYHWLRQGGLIARTFDRFIVAVLVGVIVLLLIPEVLHHMGWIAVLLALIGYLVPGLLEHAIKRAARVFHLFSLVIALVGLTLHALLDGAGLAAGGGGDHPGLSLAIVLHRFGVGLAIWLMVQPAYGRQAAWSVLVLVCIATLLGFYGSERALPMAGEDAFHYLQALIVGAIVHSLVHRTHGRAGHSH